MIHASAFQSWRKFLLAAVCVALAACSTMQKSSTGSGIQAPAPISEAAKPDASTGKSSNSSAAAGANAGSRQSSSDGSAASADSDDAAAPWPKSPDTASLNSVVVAARPIAGVAHSDTNTVATADNPILFMEVSVDVAMLAN